MNLLERVTVKMNMIMRVNRRGQDDGRRFLNLSCYYGYTWFSKRNSVCGWGEGAGGVHRALWMPVRGVCVCVCACV